MKNIIKILKEVKEEVYIVGGYIRDKFINLHVRSKDIDIVYKGDIGLLISILRKKGFKFFPLKKEWDIYRCIINNKSVDLVKMKGNSIQKDLEYRDFTMNAIAVEIHDNKIIDPFNGLKDIKKKVVRQIKENSLKNDPIRILRGIRFCIQYHFKFDIHTEKSLIDEVTNINNYPRERIHNEFMNIVKYDTRGEAFKILNRYGILKELIPYIEELKVIGKCKYHIVNAFTHMNIVYKTFKSLLNNKIKINGLDIKIFDKRIGNFTNKEYISFAAFCHDIGKAKSYKIEGTRVSFYGHDLVGANIMNEFCGKNMFPKKAKNLIVKMVEGHMYPLGLFKSYDENYKKLFYKFFSLYKEYVPYLLALSFCDVYATNIILDFKEEIYKYKIFIEKLFYEYNIYVNIKHNKLLKGNEIIDIFDAKGIQIKVLLEEIDRLRYIKGISDKIDICKYLHEYIK